MCVNSNIQITNKHWLRKVKTKTTKFKREEPVPNYNMAAPPILGHCTYPSGWVEWPWQMV
jgi:hypothetical protein